MPGRPYDSAMPIETSRNLTLRATGRGGNQVRRGSAPASNPS